mmetsp:Transcript_56036/g.167750  ORF Transcript_56036/g.167750 Transcript_56036/m.167750 type:complete len:509 (-) Transcript_56036:251-1777(-)
MRYLVVASALLTPDLGRGGAAADGEPPAAARPRRRRGHGGDRGLATPAHFGGVGDVDFRNGGGLSSSAGFRRGSRRRTADGASVGSKSLRRRAKEDATADSGEEGELKWDRSRQYHLENDFMEIGLGIGGGESLNRPEGVLPSKRIINGQNVGSASQYPFAVDMGCCSGSLVAPDVVITAAHCLWCMNPFVMVGRFNRNDPNEDYEEIPIVGNWSHPLYGSPYVPKHDYDVAVCILGGMSTRTPVTLDWGEFEMENGVDLTVIGWGLTEENEYATVLQSATVQYDEECGYFGEQKWTTPRMMCAADHSDIVKDACQGDSGAPLLRELGNGDAGLALQVGVLSWGEAYPCNVEDQPAVYTRLSAVRSWIDRQVCSMSSSSESALRKLRFRCPEFDESAGLVGGVFIGVDTPGYGFDGDEDAMNIGALGGLDDGGPGADDMLGQMEDAAILTDPLAIAGMPIVVGSWGDPDKETEIAKNAEQGSDPEENQREDRGTNKKKKKKKKNRQKK